MQIPRSLRIVLIILATVWVSHRAVVDVLVDLWWFDAVNFEQVFMTSIVAHVASWSGGAALAAGFIGGQLWLANRDAHIDPYRLGVVLQDNSIGPKHLRLGINLVLLAAVIVPTLMMAGVASSHWMTILSYLHQVPFGEVEPVFGRDVGFFVFTLPLWRAAHGFAMGCLVLSMMVVAGFVFVRDVAVQGSTGQLREGAKRQLAMMGALFFVLVAVGWWLDRFDFLYQKSGVVWGVGYADLNARIPGAWVMGGAAVIVAAVLFVQGLRGAGRARPLVVIGAYVAARVLVSGIWPDMVQDYMVRPNELQLERPFLERNIEATRLAYALDRIEVRPFEAETDLSREDIDANPLTIGNIRIWDDRPLLTTYGQIQEIRLYYDFVDVDVDRYQVDGELRQVMLSARELNYDKLPAKTWVNQHFQYTHGYGLTMSPVNEVTQEGLPTLFIKDIPPQSSVDIPITQPSIYYGERTEPYVFVQTGAEEFDFPMGDKNATTTYSGKGGVGIGTMLRKLVFSLHFGTFDVMLSQYLQPESRVLFRRNVMERVRHIMPFLHYDGDPYMVIVDGRLKWMLDAYTVSDRYPYSEPMQDQKGSRFNYIRNSVKVVIDAYDGNLSFHVADDTDPLVKVYEQIFPGAFSSMEELPAGLEDHVRYPVDFFNVQASIYRTYHMKDPTVFYNKEDLWAVPKELYGNQEQAMESYYLIMKLPEAEEEEFILLLPFVPSRKDNMISWLAARSDPEHYGKLVLFQFPKQKLIFGPSQIEARIDQDTVISEQMTLWSQAGSRVVRGNLLVIPIEGSLMYVEPLYLQAESSELPELKRVIVSYGQTIVMEETLAESLARVFEEALPDLPDLPGLDITTAEGGEAKASPAKGVALPARIAQAVRIFESAKDASQSGDWAAYGVAIRDLERVLAALKLEAADEPR